MQHQEGCPAFHLFGTFTVDDIADMRKSVVWHDATTCHVPKIHPACWLFDMQSLESGFAPLGSKDVIPGKDVYIMDRMKCEELLGTIRHLVMQCTCGNTSASVTSKQIGSALPPEHTGSPSKNGGGEEASGMGGSAAAAASSVAATIPQPPVYPVVSGDTDSDTATLDEHIRTLGSRVRRCLGDVERGLSHLRRGDLTNPSLTEAGFKAAILVALATGMPDVTIHSEFVVEGGYVDLIVVDTVHMVAILYELKYVPCSFIQETGWSPKLPFREVFAKCDQMTQRLGSMSWPQVSALHYRSPKTKRYETFASLARDAFVQALRYKDALMNGGIRLRHDGNLVLRLGVSNIIGVSTRAFDSQELERGDGNGDD